MHCCSPTRSALHTARYNIRYGLQSAVIPNNKEYGLALDEMLLPEYLKRLGYATHAVGKVRRPAVAPPSSSEKVAPPGN